MARAPDPNEPLPLSIAVDIAYPHGGITVRSLRTERDKGNLETFKVAGREFTTLADIREMERRCRERQRALASTCEGERVAKQSGSSAMAPTNTLPSAEMDVAAARAIVERLKKPSADTSRQSTGRTRANVIPIG